MTLPANPPGGEDGGPAFPHPQYPASQGSGMSLRDWFAGQALAMAIPEYVNLPDSAALLAKRSYAVADAMLKARAALTEDIRHAE